MDSSSRVNHNCLDYVPLLKRIFEKLYEDIFEAFHRTPNTISSKPYVERALRLVQSGLNIVNEMQRCIASNT